MSSRRQTRPASCNVSPKSLLNLPHRLCNPPPATHSSRSYGVTPAFKIHLEDVLDRQHLPPLGLKDFEEWLLYVEQCPENLYFILWLKDYTLRHKQWKLQLSPQPTNAPDYRPAFPTQTASQLLMFYARAKQTFFTPNSEYELNVPSDILSPFHSSKFGSTPPDPAVFANVACEVQSMLNQSLQRFLVAAYSNVGTNRGLCGILGGLAIVLLGSLPPIIYSLLTGKSRWLRLTALPGIWLGLTIVIASLHGVCMMIYIFGDLRQLRKFELQRPPISPPRPLIQSPPPTSCHVTVPTPITRQPLLPPNQPPRRMSLIPPPPRALIRDPDLRTRTISTSSSSSASSVTSSHSSTEGVAEIHISPAYFDQVPVDIASMVNSVARDSDYNIQTGSPTTADDTSLPFTATASFIHPYDPSTDNDQPLPEHHQPISAFDFDALPSLPYPTPLPSSTSPAPPAVIQPDKSSHCLQLTPKSLLARAQYQCNLNVWKINAVGSAKRSSTQEPSSPTTTAAATPAAARNHRWRDEKAPASIKAQYKLVKAVPAFSSPVTRVLNPLVVRAQWEIVVRSALFAFKASCIILACMLVIPVRRV